jgi:hypothetical protein
MKFITSYSATPTKRILHASILSVALLGAGSVFAQRAPSGLEMAIYTASKWVAKADANQAADMWKASDVAMQKNVNQVNWAKYIGEIRKRAGAEQSRTWVAVTKMDNPKGMPPGEYLNVIYDTKFANAATVETVSMAKSGSYWKPIGYVVRPAQPQDTTTAAAKPAPAGK